jgi:hypothetical protein
MSEAHKEDLYRKGCGGDYSQVTSTMIPVDSLIRASGFTDIALFILDVEGYENKVLRRLVDSVIFPQMLVVEFDWSSQAELKDILEPYYKLVYTGNSDFVFERK